MTKVKDKLEFSINDNVVYPAHGVGLISEIETQTIGGMALTVYVVKFEKDRMTLRIPVQTAVKSGLRRLCTMDDLKKVRTTLRSKARTSRGMWSRRAKEYETKINSGNIISLAEVVRDLHKNIDDPDRSYSERMIYENALSRLVGEVAAIQDIEHEEAVSVVVESIASNKNREAA
ncbi:MAG: CarD family transcriptional regulator [Hyphomicrobiales bacterium]|nr:CarD family transcriptional regulator [Hyphomicrobiales bacterium]